MKKSRQPSPPCIISKEPYKKDCIMQTKPMNVLALMTRALASVLKALVALWLISKGCFGSDETHTCIISKDSCGSFCRDCERVHHFKKILPYKKDYIMQKRPMNVLALVTRALWGSYD